MSVFMSYCPQFWGSKAICMARKTRYMFESYDQKLIVFAFYGRFNELLPTVFGVSGRFAWLERPDTCLRVRTKNPWFLRFMAVFMSYCPYFSGSRAICMARKTRYMFERYAKNSSFSCFMVVFMSYCPLFRVCRAICMARKTRYMFESYDQKLRFCVL